MSQTNDLMQGPGGYQEPGDGGFKEKVYLTVIVLLVCAVGVLTYLFVEKSAELDTIFIENKDLQAEGDEVREELQLLESDYSNLQTDNEALQTQIDEQKERIADYLEQIEKNKGDKYLIYKLKKEAKTLRSIMQGYVRDIDSLQQLNKKLNFELEGTKNDLKNVADERDSYAQQNEDLQETVSKGAILKSANFNIYGLKVKSNGSTKETDRARLSDKIAVCMDILENKIAKKGERYVYVIIKDPSGKVLNPKGGSAKFNTAAGVSKEYSDRRKITYENQDVPVCVYWEGKEELTKGTYKIEVWIDGSLTGKDDLYLK